MNLLIIEDDEILADRIAKSLNLTGNFNNIKVINSYESFLGEYHIINSYDIILVDILLSKDLSHDNNGIKIVNLIRKKSEIVPIIIIS